MNCRAVSFIYVYPALAHLLTKSDKSGWVAGQPKISMFGATGSAMTPLSKTLPKSLSNQQPRNSSVPLGLNLDSSFLAFPAVQKRVQMVVTLATVPAAFGWQESITSRFYFFSLSFTYLLVLAQRWKSWEQILRYAQPIWSPQPVICSFYFSPGDA